jgi:hypothetical protein
MVARALMKDKVVLQNAIEFLRRVVVHGEDEQRLFDTVEGLKRLEKQNSDKTLCTGRCQD